MCSNEATRLNIVSGMKLSEAQAVCAGLVWKQYDEALYKHSQKKLSRELIGCSPKVTALEPGIFLLDAAGLNYVGGEQTFCRNIQKIAGKMGYRDLHIGIADSAFAATVASQFKRSQYYIVPAGDDRHFLKPLAIKHLPISLETQESLHELGIRTIGQMISLNEDSLVQRFGREGTIAYELSNGIDKRQPYLPPMEREFKCSVDLGSPIELLNEIQFVLKSMLDRLTREMKAQGWWAEELQLSFFNGDEKFDDRVVKLLRPSNHPKFLLEVMKLSLESNPIKREVTGITLCISRFAKEAWHQSPIEFMEDAVDGKDSDGNPIGRNPLSLTLMLQRFMAKLGEEAVVRSIPNDQHMPEHAGAWLPVTTKPTVTPVVPVNVSYINARVGAAGLASGLTLRKCQSPVAVLVEFQGDSPTALTYAGKWYRVKHITEPERLSGLWWENPVRKSYYVALLELREHKNVIALNDDNANAPESGLLVSLVHDHEQSGWFVNGFYD